MTTTILVKERLAACLILFRRDAANADLGQDEDRVVREAFVSGLPEAPFSTFHS